MRAGQRFRYFGIHWIGDEGKACYHKVMNNAFIDRLVKGPILCDGAMGTLLLAAGAPAAHPFDELNLSRPALVGDIHRDYIAAGAEIIETNTFGANHARLEPHGLAARVRELNVRGVKIARDAREVSGEDVFVAGAVGPLGRPNAVHDLGPARVRAIFAEQVEGLLEGGADLLLFETFGDAEELALAVEAARSACDLPVVAQLTFDEDGRTLAGQTARETVARLRRLDIAVLGTNCNLGPQATLDVVEELAALAPGMLLSAQPNAGLPRRVGGRFIYGAGPEYVADYARRYADAGVTLIGGCCGTTPAHTRAMRAALSARLPDPPPAPAPRTPARRAAHLVAHPMETAESAAEGGPEPTHLQRLLAEGRWVVSVEMKPPRGINPTKALRGAETLRDEGSADAVNITDGAMARVRMGALPLAYLIRERLGLDTIVHMTTRDRNLMALQSDLVGAHAHDVRNILALHGDPVHAGDYPNASGIWDVDSVGLIEVMGRLNRGEDAGGAPIGRPAGFHIGCAVDPTKDWDFVRERLRQKLAAGAHYIMSQPVYDLEEFHRFLDYLGPLSVPFLVGVMPLHSHRHAEYLHNEVPGIDVPEPIRRRMAEAGENGGAEGIAMARDFLAGVASRVQGAYLMPSFGRYEVVSAVIRDLPGR
jgi:methionine synthase I (cobalamin-dependent)/5,10-methylenetetrahydrofolate reductase